ncbi:glycosyltransferase [Methanosphaera sp.]
MSFTDKLKNSIVSRSNSYKYYKNHYDKFVKDIDMKNKHIIRLQNTNNSLIKESDKNKSKIHSLEEKNKKDTNKINSLEKKQDTNNKLIKELKTKNSELTNNITSLEYDANKYAELIQLLRETSDDNVKIIHSLKEDNSNLVELNLSLETEKLKLYHENEELLKQTQELSEINKEYSRKICENCKLSVIMPIFNAEIEHLERSIGSVMNQTMGFNNIELILVDDASTKQDTIDFIVNYDNIYPNIKTILLEENRGPGNARNIGIEHASTDYIMFLDHDDYYTKNACEILYSSIVSDNMDVVGGNYINFTQTNGERVSWDSFGLEYKTTVNSVLENINLLKIAPSIWTKIYRKSFLKENNIEFLGYKSGQDLIFSQEVLFHANGIIFIDEVIVEYEIRNDDSKASKSLSVHNTKEILMDLMKVHTKSYDLFSEFYPENKYVPLNAVNYLITKRICKSNLNYDEFKEVCLLANRLFKLFLDCDKTVKYDSLNNFYNYVANEKYDDAYHEYLKLRK